ncbi:hypothetical protein BDV25DRAFT_152486 [Aspergillus avenaceus]|uniref:Uncharacterized protein n=1 Tax=Aspergillus avenaceus TaxID=36643 RepID=A0A5N6TZ31_ASPAV|nr:hypothetical protein BDV25DRAFT_152486 [Aspergillus avenaceus]
MLEAAYTCYVGDLGWTTSGLSYNAETTDGQTMWKENIYVVDTLDGAAGVMKTDPSTGLSYLDVIPDSVADARVTVHEYGHALTYHARNWVDQQRTGAWWETIANWVAETYNTSPLCARARSQYKQATGDSLVELQKVIGDSYQVIVDASTDTGNYYQAWPFFTYLTNNPDNFTGLGTDTVRELFRQYKVNSNETPLHTLARVSTSATVQEIVGRYWAHMAYFDIGHPIAQKRFFSQRETLNYANIEAQGDDSYVVKSARMPQYMGANIIPLQTTGAGNVEVSVNSDGEYVATLAIHNTNTGKVRYVTLRDGAGSAAVDQAEEASLVVANTPSSLYLYDGFNLSDEVRTGLQYSLKISGATA